MAIPIAIMIATVLSVLTGFVVRSFKTNHHKFIFKRELMTKSRISDNVGRSVTSVLSLESNNTFLSESNEPVESTLQISRYLSSDCSYIIFRSIWLLSYRYLVLEEIVKSLQARVMSQHDTIDRLESYITKVNSEVASFNNLKEKVSSFR